MSTFFITSCDKNEFDLSSFEVENTYTSKWMTTTKSLKPFENINTTRHLIANAQEKLTAGTLEEGDKVKITIYGQSLCSSDNKWVLTYFPEELKKKYGDIFIFNNKSRLGWQSWALLTVVEEDIGDTDPDLVVIHDYSYRDGSYESLLFQGVCIANNIQSWRVSSEAFNRDWGATVDISRYDHIIGQLGIRQMINERGNNIEVLLLNDHPRIPNNTFENQSVELYRTWAIQNNMGYLDLRNGWKAYLEDVYGNSGNINRNKLLSDDTHLNDLGQYVWAHFVLQYFEINYDIH